jgi:hypothetical protein
MEPFQIIHQINSKNFFITEASVGSVEDIGKMGISLKLQLEIYPDGDPNFYPGDDN